MEREATFLLLSVCSTYLFVHECCFNAVSGHIVRIDETEHFEEELPSISVRHNALRYILHRVHVLSIKQEYLNLKGVTYFREDTTIKILSYPYREL